MYTWRACFVALLSFLLPSTALGYSLLTHEEIVDIAWHDQLVPLLRARFTNATPAQLHDAHAYAYGGCLIQDLGYYPFGSKFFSDLTHYVRSGDFVTNLIAQATDINEYAFALGALAHYTSDNSGHPLVNRAVALSFPKLRSKYGDEVTYADCPTAHIQTEFGFDMEQVAKARYSSEQYRSFIGFEVAKASLDRAFLLTYGLTPAEVLGHEDLAIGSFRRAVSQFMPELTKAALLARRPQLVQEKPGFNEGQFLFNLSRAEYERQWGTEYRRPSILARILAFIWHLIPKVGRFKALDFKDPTPQTEALYIRSINHTVDQYKHLLAQIEDGLPLLPDLDCDTGRPARSGEYNLADKTYAQLLDRLAKHGFQRAPEPLRRNILSFYAEPLHSGNSSQLQLSYRTQRQLRLLQELERNLKKL